MAEKCGSCTYFVQIFNRCEMNGFATNADEEACRFFMNAVTMEGSGLCEDPESEDACDIEEDETPGGIYVEEAGEAQQC